MANVNLKVQRFRENDLSVDSGKQFELGKSWCKFLGIDEYVGEIEIPIYFKALSSNYSSFDDNEIILKLSELTERKDRKVYANGSMSGHSAIKEFFLQKLCLNSDQNKNDYFAIYKAPNGFNYLYYIPEILYKNFISFFESVTPVVSLVKEPSKNDNSYKSLQQIFYGAPGTGKSNTIRKEVDEKKKKNFRVTFHPDSDYSTFVGCYKPTMKETVITKDGVESKEEQIVYRFVPQAFTKAYTAAWNTEDEVYLIIEEINRGNCAQIFGDLFQLLDRKNGFSEYPVDTDTDMEDHINKELTNSTRKDFPEGVKEGKKLVLPQNLYIWATMNTSDQSLFPIDSAFKRRWNWKYMPINDAGMNWEIEVKGVRYGWGNFLKKINEQIGTTTSSEDKKLGYFFCEANNYGIIDAEMFVGKVIFYLWNDVFKDYDLDGVLFVDEDENGKKSKLTFDKFYTSVNGETKVVEEKIEQFLKNLGVEPNVIDEDEDGNPTDPKNPRRKNYDKFSIDGEGRWGKNRLAFECVKEYVNRNPEMTASDVFNVWEKINPGVGPHFIELETVWKNRTDKSKDRSSEIICKDDSKLYVLRNGYGSNGMVERFMENVNGNQSIGQIIERHK